MAEPKRKYLTRIHEYADSDVTFFEVFDLNDEGKTVALFSSINSEIVEALLSLLRTMTAKPARRVRYPKLRAVRAGAR